MTDNNPDSADASIGEHLANISGYLISLLRLCVNNYQPERAGSILHICYNTEKIFGLLMEIGELLGRKAPHSLQVLRGMLKQVINDSEEMKKMGLS